MEICTMKHDGRQWIYIMWKINVLYTIIIVLHSCDELFAGEWIFFLLEYKKLILYNFYCRYPDENL